MGIDVVVDVFGFYGFVGSLWYNVGVLVWLFDICNVLGGVVVFVCMVIEVIVLVVVGVVFVVVVLNLIAVGVVGFGFVAAYFCGVLVLIVSVFNVDGLVLRVNLV